MRLRNVNPGIIVDSRIMAMKAGLDVSWDELETHYLASGNVVRVIQALIAASKANINLTFQQSTAIDLAEKSITSLYVPGRTTTESASTAVSIAA